MIETSFPIVFLPGSGNIAPDLMLLRSGPDDPTGFATIHYPDWRRYAAGNFSNDQLIAELVDNIAAMVPSGPIHIIGLSIGGHFGYVAALRLRAQGREIGGFCAIDAFMIETADATPGWQGRALSQALELLRKRSLGEFLEFARSKFWRGLLRSTQSVLPHLLRAFPGRKSGLSTIDPVLDQELSMRLMVRETAPWLASLDDNPEPLDAPATLLRTSLTADDDAAWRRRCPQLVIHKLPGQHRTLFDPENIAVLRDALATAMRGWRQATTKDADRMLC
jgi:thioesterase domain-containing protein